MFGKEVYIFCDRIASMDLRLILPLSLYLLISSNYANCSPNIEGDSETASSPTEQSIAASWVNLQISPNVVCYKRFKNVMIKVYEHAKNLKTVTDVSEKRYFFAPVGFLDHNTSVSIFNSATGKAELRFRVFMWGDNVRREIIKECFNNSVPVQQVQVLPFEQVRLFSTTASATYSLPAHWLPYQQHTYFRFVVQCVKKKDCDMLAANMKRNPQHFDHFKLQYSMSSQSSRTRETLIRISAAVSGDMASNLLQRFQNEKEALLTAEDKKNLIKEMTTNVMMQSVDDSEVVSSSSELKVYDILENMLQSTVESTKDMNDRMWESVFWDNDNYRPDKVANTLNDNYKKLDKDTQRKVSNAAKSSVEAGLKAGGWGVSVEANVGISSETATSREDANRLVQEAKDNVVWDGEKFTPKPMSLQRINLAELRNRKSFKDTRVKIQYTIAVLMTPLNILLTLDEEVRDDHPRRSVEKISNPSSQSSEIPTSCSDLRRQGQIVSGIHFVLGSGQLIEAVHCDFNKPTNDKDYQRGIGFVEVKSKLAYFSAKRSDGFSATHVPVPFPYVKVNAGGAFDGNSGIFTAPTNGIYFFLFQGVASGSGNLGASICVKPNYGLGESRCLAKGWSEEANYDPISLHVTETLEKGDHIYLMISDNRGTKLHDNEGGFSTFSGWLLHEEIRRSVY